ncbi:oligopeptide/dipeptide ABC transporter ATP-binding protein [Pseudonocardia kunmingensis]|uniref:Peptide/nickel transport system ATP-binding protein/oligopeptide transport system ATP-binding protein n=1 Tax=Pseudonocardia kunmingensis TaxID=630975 RepID=A0A543CXT7_9PSEU|nr:oligopeptide/dipeptide ABC transporter ATP-binding protein [Pseudonocardia kunmingensis]TQM01933.1 peptide/nickel transport system ATP-binding protein/oligopeptide transport system ATP-binding protein [Pseudonocardia kunmingensis]
MTRSTRSVDREEKPVHVPVSAGEHLLRAQGLHKAFVLARDLLGRPVARTTAVDGIDLHVAHGETVGVVGESGSGKTTVGRMLARLLVPDAGRIELDGRDVTRVRGRELTALRRTLQVVFQDPYGSLDPTKPVGSAVTEPLVVHRLAGRRELPARAAELLDAVALDPVLAQRYPHELSGGQRQRAAIARAMALEPRLLVADEPTSALDLSTRSEILNLLLGLQRDRNLSIVLISHDFATVRHLAHRIVVMYRGRVIEQGPAEDLLAEPLHPYTGALLAAARAVRPDDAAPRERVALRSGRAARPEAPGGCAFYSRCPVAMDACAEADPALVDVGAGHSVACLHHDHRHGQQHAPTGA